MKRLSVVSKIQRFPENSAFTVCSDHWRGTVISHYSKNVLPRLWPARMQMEDTDSMAIVATEHSGLVECPRRSTEERWNESGQGSLHRSRGEIANRFKLLNPYDRSAVRGQFSRLKKVFNPETGKQRQIWCYAISAKRYALFLDNNRGASELLRKGKNSSENHWSEHGLGHLLNPTDPEIAKTRVDCPCVAREILNPAIARPTRPVPFQNTPAVGRVV